MENDTLSSIQPDYRAQARKQLKGNWGIPIAFTLTYGIIQAILFLIIHFIFHVGVDSTITAIMLLVSPLVLSSTIFYVRLSKKETVSVGIIFSGFKYLLASSVIYLVLSGLSLIDGTGVLKFKGVGIYLSLLTTIASGFLYLYYNMSYYIIAVEDNITVTKALSKSRKIMYGHKMELFLLQFSFIGWFFVGIITCGIGLLWVVPYMELTLANFFLNIKQSETNSYGN